MPPAEESLQGLAGTMAFADDQKAQQKFTALWQAQNPHEREWVEEIFGPYLSGHVTDGKHELVLDNAILFDAFVYCHDPAYYARFRGKNAFLVHFNDENYEGRYELYKNFRGVFRCHWSSVFNPKYVMKLPLGYSAGMRRQEKAERASQRKYLWSFVGNLQKASRPEMAKALSPLEPQFLYATDDVPRADHGKTPRSFHRSEYSEFLAQSAFSPCPMGNVNLECFRVYEALECGSIPIVERRLTLDYFRLLLGDHPLPTISSWAEAFKLIGRMRERPEEIDALQEQCTEWWSGYKRQYSAAAGEFLALRSSENYGAYARPMVSRRQRLPLWQAIELVRHHNLNALARRVHRQAVRLIKQGKLRVAHRPGAPTERTTLPR